MKMFVLSEPLIEKLGKDNFDLMRLYQERKNFIKDLQKDLVQENKKLNQIDEKIKKAQNHLNEKKGEIFRLEYLFKEKITEQTENLKKEKDLLDKSLQEWNEKEKIVLGETQKNLDTFDNSIIFNYLYNRLNKSKFYWVNHIDEFLGKQISFKQELVKYNALKILPDLIKTKIEGLQAQIQEKDVEIEDKIQKETGESLANYLSLKKQLQEINYSYKEFMEEKEKNEQSILNIEKEIQNYEQHIDPMWDEITTIAKNMLKK